MPSAWTFTIKPIAELLERYIGDGKGWIDPFAGKSKLAEFRNDMNPERCQPFQLDAFDFCDHIKLTLNGALFDPPYSLRQISEHYLQQGVKAKSIDTSANFYSRVLDKLSDKIKAGGYGIRMGWNSNGFGKKRGFEMVEILLVAHGGSKNDTIVTVEQKIQSKLFS